MFPLLHDSSSQDSLDSQYEEVRNRTPRSLSSDQSFDEDDTADGLYSCVQAPSAPQDPGEYSFVGAASLPRPARNDGDAGMYELVGSRPASKSAPPTYEMVHSPKKDPPENDAGLYDLVPGPTQGKATSPTQEKATAPQTFTNVEKREDATDVAALYSTVPKITRKQNHSLRGLSMISEGDSEEADEKAPPLPSKAALGDAVAIYEIKRLLEETSKGEDEIDDKGKDANDEEDEPRPAETGNAFKQLKAFLQKLDSTEEE